jgi:hypothetical protein
MWLSWIDNRTIFACQTLMTAVYAIVFLCMGGCIVIYLAPVRSLSAFFQAFSDAS